MTQEKNNTSALVRAHLAVLLFGLAGVIGRYVHSSALAVTFARVLLSSLSLGLLFLSRKQSVAVRSRKDLGLLIFAGIVMAAHWTLFMASVQKAGVAIGTITFATFPLFVTFLEPLCFHERLKIGNVIPAMVMLAGVLVLVPPEMTDRSMIAGIALGMGSSLTYAILSLLNRRLASGYDSTLVCFHEQAVATIVLLPVLFLVRPEFRTADIPFLIILGVVCTALAHTLFIGSLPRIKVRTAGIISGMETVYGIALACLLLGEFPTVREIIGGVIILSVTIYITIKSKS